VREASAGLGLHWFEPLGFDNSFRLLMRADQAALGEVHSIADLGKLKQGVRIASPLEYLRRPRDGMASLIRQHGIRQQGPPVVLDDINQRYQALTDGRVEVAVGYSTDAPIEDLGLAMLADTQGFFSPYEAAVLVRSELLARHPQLEPALRALGGQIGTAEMRRLNYAVQVEGRAAASVAGEFLARKGLVKGKALASSWTPGVVIAAHQADPLPGLNPIALRAARAAFPDRSVATRLSADPATDVASGRTRLALLSAERFFRLDGDEGLLRRDERLEALAVVGFRLVHVIRRTKEPEGSPAFQGRIGLAAVGTSGELIGRMLLSMTGVTPTVHSTEAGLLDRVREGQLDAALLVVPVGDPSLARALATGALRLAPLPSDQAFGGVLLTAPYLRPTRVPSGTYAHQDEAVDTYGLQVVLAGPARTPSETRIGGGHVAALRERGQPLTEVEIRRLAEAMPIAEQPDPALPSAWTFRSAERAPFRRDVGWLDTMLNLLIFAFLLWLVHLVLHPIGRRPSVVPLAAGQEAPQHWRTEKLDDAITDKGSSCPYRALWSDTMGLITEFLTSLKGSPIGLPGGDDKQG
jgi:hypothetical protein